MISQEYQDEMELTNYEILCSEMGLANWGSSLPLRAVGQLNVLGEVPSKSKKYYLKSL